MACYEHDVTTKQQKKNTATELECALFFVRNIFLFLYASFHSQLFDGSLVRDDIH